MGLTLAFGIGADGRADLVFRAGTLALDRTVATPAIAALVCDRRARTDDPLPMPAAPLLEPDTLNPRRGWCGDALDREGRRIGSRLWLLVRALETEGTRRRAEFYAREALAGFAETGLEVTAAWLRRGVLRLRCRIGRDEVEIARVVS